ncbi:MAG: SDR family NAD(P)-dependent oxidoreductase [Deltaproteobacteria bacterium]|jgi:NAD(P)-dependent dehydrogenase (short-subunit alcohol dehydrogenase family)|nr:SDR family NAD(P)-dependent oxidoreductase [Deltaproteobacteria bacterium]
MTERRVAIVTGANGAIGVGICQGLAERNYEVVMVCRNAGRARQADGEIEKAVSGARLRIEIVDVSRKQEIAALAGRFAGRLDVLVNNAAVAPRRRTETPEGIETEFATNVLGYVWMMQAFEKALSAAAPARIVNVASYWAGDLDLDDLEFKRRDYNNDTAYRQSKQCNRMLTVAFARRWPPSQITVNACHPGDVHSTLSHALGYGGHESPEQGADTPVWLATDPSVAGVTGKYFAGRRQQACQFAKDEQAIARLLEICESW